MSMAERRRGSEDAGAGGQERRKGEQWVEIRGQAATKLGLLTPQSRRQFFPSQTARSEFRMSQSRNATKAGLTALALLVCLGTKADAAQCGSTAAGYDTWKRQFAEQARGKGISASSLGPRRAMRLRPLPPTATREALACRSSSFSPSAVARRLSRALVA